MPEVLRELFTSMNNLVNNQMNNLRPQTNTICGRVVRLFYPSLAAILLTTWANSPASSGNTRMLFRSNLSSFPLRLSVIRK